MTVALSESIGAVDANFTIAEVGYLATLVSGQTLTVTDSTPLFQLPYLTATGKVKLITEVASITGGTSPGVTVSYYESVDGGTTYNGTAALTSGALTATGATYSSVASGPVFNAGKLTFTVTGSPTGIVLSVYLAAWNK
jgi:hypothetical protein